MKDKISVMVITGIDTSHFNDTETNLGGIPEGSPVPLRTHTQTHTLTHPCTFIFVMTFRGIMCSIIMCIPNLPPNPQAWPKLNCLEVSHKVKHWKLNFFGGVWFRLRFTSMSYHFLFYYIPFIVSLLYLSYCKLCRFALFMWWFGLYTYERKINLTLTLWWEILLSNWNFVKTQQ